VTRRILGIDLGTTYSLVGALVNGEPTLFPNANGALLTPSAIGVDHDGQMLTGEAARSLALTAPDRAVRFFKRDMGTLRKHRLGDRDFTPVELSALVLGALKRDAEEALGQPMLEAVITVPAYFGDAQRQATRDAGALAGLQVHRVLNEPTAAALAYGLHQRHREMRCVVLDLGGGTFDVTVLEIIEGVIEIASSAGDARLGGEDFTDALAEKITARVQTEHSSCELQGPLMRARLREACELAKRRLGAEPTTRLVLPNVPAGRGEIDVDIEVTREDLERASLPLLSRMRVPIERALRDAKMPTSKIDEVLMVGGATRMRSVVELAGTTFGRLPLRSLPADEPVAHGAAIQAALIADDAAVDDLVVTDVAPFSLGIATAERLGGTYVPGIFTPILERGTVLPASRSRTFSTIADDQTRILVEVYQGEHASVADNERLGELEVTGLPRAPAGAMGLEVRFSYDLDGILEVDASYDGKPTAAQVVIQNRKGKLDPLALERARAALQKLKIHPRETLPNRTALARADALHVELTGGARQHLAEAMRYFRAALETQDPKIIEQVRGQLIAVMDRLR